MLKHFFTFVFITLMASSVFAVDLANRLGLGYSQQIGATEVPLITAHYYPNSRFGLSGGVGIDTKKDESKFAALLKAHRIIFTENQMNFYMGGAVGYSNHELMTGTTVEDRSNFEMMALIGGEFFFTGLDSLGFSFETGISVQTGDGGSRFRTIGDHPFRAGIVFYF
jgi:hypothetical protein